MFLNHLIDKLHDSIHHHETALNYLKGRKVTDEVIKTFKLGYSRVVAAGDDGSEDYKNFNEETYRGKALENKLIFPIYDMLGNPAGILGRAIDSKKFILYLTLESKFMGAFFGLPQALPFIYETGRVFTVEGPFDFLAFRKVYPNVVGTLTAELTEAQHDLLSLYAKEIITVFDSDVPGRKAAERAEKFSNVKTISLGFKDPDGVLKYYNNFDEYTRYVKRKVGEILWMK